VAAGSLLAACAPAVPQVVKETVVVPQTVPAVKETVLVPQTPGPTGVPAPAKAAVYEVLPPYGHPTITLLQPSKRLDTLDGKTVCGIMGGAYRFNETWPMIKDVLAKKYPTAKFVGTLEFIEGTPNVAQSAIAEGGSFGHAGVEDALLEALPALLKKYKCDAAVVGNGC